MKQYKAYLIKLKCVPVDLLRTKFKLHNKHYECCENGIIVLTNDLATAINKLSQDNILEIKEYGIGYVIEGEETNKEE